MSRRTIQPDQHDDLLAEIRAAQVVIRAAWKTYPDMRELTAVLDLLWNKLEGIEKAAQNEARCSCRLNLPESEAPR